MPPTTKPNRRISCQTSVFFPHRHHLGADLPKKEIELGLCRFAIPAEQHKRAFDDGGGGDPSPRIGSDGADQPLSGGFAGQDGDDSGGVENHDQPGKPWSS
jgi:hypothetical protein